MGSAIPQTDGTRLPAGDRTAEPDWFWRAAYGAFVAIFAVSPLIHVAIVVRDPEVYRPFADHALFGWVTDAWRDVFMANPGAWGLAVAVGELLIAVLLVVWRPVGHLAVVAFTAALMLFGWGFWIWSLPVLAIAVPAMMREFRQAGR